MPEFIYLYTKEHGTCILQSSSSSTSKHPSSSHCTDSANGPRLVVEFQVDSIRQATDGRVYAEGYKCSIGRTFIFYWCIFVVLEFDYIMIDYGVCSCSFLFLILWFWMIELHIEWCDVILYLMLFVVLSLEH